MYIRIASGKKKRGGKILRVFHKAYFSLGGNRFRPAFAPNQQSDTAQREERKRTGFRDLSRRNRVADIALRVINHRKGVAWSAIHGDAGPAILQTRAAVKLEADEARAWLEPLAIRIAVGECHCSDDCAGTEICRIDIGAESKF